MPLTVAWWKESKKSHGKGAPSTGFEALLKNYETAMKNVGKAKTIENTQSAINALAAVVKGRTVADVKLKDDKWANLRGDLKSLDRHIKSAQSELDEIMNSLMLDKKVELAGSVTEGKYEQLYAVFEKQEAALKSQGDRVGFKTAQATLDKLLVIAEQCKETPSLIGKYNKQISVLNGKKVEVANLSQQYENKIRACVALRQKAIGEIEEMDSIVTRTKAQMEGILKKVVEAKSQGNQAELTKQRSAAGVIIKGIAAKAQEIADKYLASGTVVKDSTDVKAAKMSTPDLEAVIMPLSNQLFQLNRANKLMVAEITKLGQQIMS
jgi:hypothetical protein